MKREDEVWEIVKRKEEGEKDEQRHIGWEEWKKHFEIVGGSGE